MPNALELYRAWERSPDRRVVYVLIFERGDLSAANRLTVTTKPYYDKGVVIGAGRVKYHHTYSAPFHGVLSDIGFDEDDGDTSINDVILANGSGRFDGILAGPAMVKNPVTILRGDASWSLMETELPYRFEVFVRGTVEQVLFDAQRRVRIKLSPRELNLDRRVGWHDFPRGWGECFNVPFVLVDSVTHRYKCNSRAMATYEANVAVRDQGVLLGHPDGAAPDYSFVLDEEGDGFWYGTIQFPAAPAGEVTGDFNLDRNHQVFKNARHVIYHEALDDYSIFAQQIAADDVAERFQMLDGEARFYTLYFNQIVGLSLAVPGDLATVSEVTIDDVFDLLGIVTEARAHFVNNSETLLWVLESDPSNKIYQFSFGAAGEPPTLALDDTFDLSAIAGDLEDLYVSPDGSRLLILERDGLLHQLTFAAPGTLASLAFDNITADLRGQDRRPRAFTVSREGRALYMGGNSTESAYQYTLAEAYSIEALIYDRRDYFLGANVTATSPINLHASDASMFLLNEGFNIWRLDFVDGDYQLPRSAFESNVFDGSDEESAAVWYNTLTPIGQILGDLVASINCNYTVDRLGAVRATQPKAGNYVPEDWEVLHPLHFGDFQGAAGSHIRHESVEPPANLVGIYYSRNFNVQSTAGLSNLLTEDQIYDYTNPKFLHQLDNELVDRAHAVDVYIDKAVGTFASAERIAPAVAALHESERNTYQLQLKLHCTSLLSDFGIGSLIQVGNDWRHPDFAVGDIAMVRGRRVNGSKETQVLRVYK